MRRMLEAAGQPDVPGLYVSRACSYFWRTVPFLARDPRRQDDIVSRAPDYAADSCRSALAQPGGLTARQLYGGENGVLANVAADVEEDRPWWSRA